MSIVAKPALKSAFATLYTGGARFSLLLPSLLRIAGYTKADIAEIASVPERQIKSAIQGDLVPTAAIRRAFDQSLGFDPWAVIHAIDAQHRRYDIPRETEHSPKEPLDDAL